MPYGRGSDIPPKLRKKLDEDPQLAGAVVLTAADFRVWFENNNLAFFPEYTDHGADHIRYVLEAACYLIGQGSWRLLTAADAAALVLSTLLHDCAMHLSEDGFIRLVTEGQPPAPGFDDPPWPRLWGDFLREASRFDERKLKALFGDSRPTRTPPLAREQMTYCDRLLIGEFVRRHHPRLAHEIALHGVPGPQQQRLTLREVPNDFADLAGLIARSHGLSIRAAAEMLPEADRRLMHDVHSAFIMAVLRIADYIQLQSGRAPEQILKVRALISPVSRLEWKLHKAVREIQLIDNDPEALRFRVSPESATEFVRLQRLFASIQRELDESWAVMGEVYGRFRELRDFGLKIRRVKSNLDDRRFAASVPYIPMEAAFTTAGGNVLKLLIGPLYENRPEIGVRELVQNAVDAVRELKDYGANAAPNAADGVDSTMQGDVLVSIIDAGSGNSVLSVRDRGIGMTAATITNYFLCAGASFRQSDYWREHHTDGEGRSRVLRSGRFGIGVLAGFLIGDRIEVITRHVSEPEGISFTADLESDIIELKKGPAPVGTTITIPLRDPRGAWLRFDPDWDWYCLAEPSVLRLYGGRVLDQRDTWPAEREEAAQWRSLESGGLTVRWSYEHRSVASLACNGIRISAREDESRNEEEDRYRHVVAIDMAIATPKLSIFDREGRLPLNLQRTKLAARGLPFEDDLAREIARDALAYAAVALPSEPSRVFERSVSVYYPGIVTGDRTLVMPHFFATPQGWAPFDPMAFAFFDVDRVVIGISGTERPLRFSFGVTGHHMVPWHVSYSSERAWLHTLFDHSGFARMSRGIQIVMAKSVFHELIREEEFNDCRMDTLGRNVLVKKGTDFELSFDPADIQDLGSDGKVVEVLLAKPLRRSSKTSRVETLLNVWRDIIGIPAVPFSHDERRAILEKEEVRPYAEAYQRRLQQ
ncbi:MAG TPA: ATP-binding protein [Thermoanaerobaculia bacterium]|nr:ATP-binding protein [Thermoanaerobaculia bacterium]